MDGAWAVYEAWVKMQIGKADIALVYAYGKSSPGDIRRVLTRQLDPYYTRPAVGRLRCRSPPCRPGPVSTPARSPSEQMAEVVAANRRDAKANPYAQLSAATPSRARC